MNRQQPPRAGRFDARGTKQERLSTYFDFTFADGSPDSVKAGMKVTRMELLAVLDAIEKGKRENTPLRRLWRWLRAKRGSGGVHAVPPTKGEIERGEAKPG